MTPDNQTHDGSVGTEDELGKEQRLLRWSRKIGESFRTETAQGFVIARTDFTISEAEDNMPQGIKRKKEGWDQIMFRGGINGTEARPYVAVVESAVRVFNLSRPPEANELRVVSVEVDALSQEIGRVGDIIDRSTLKSVGDSMGDKRILMFSYQQPNPEDIARGDATKTVCLYVDKKDAGEILDLVDQGVDPNLVWGALRYAFTDDYTRDYWDDTLVYSSSDTPTDSPRERRHMLNSYDKRVFETTAGAAPVLETKSVGLDIDDFKFDDDLNLDDDDNKGVPPNPPVEPQDAPPLGPPEHGGNLEDESNPEQEELDKRASEASAQHLGALGDIWFQVDTLEMYQNDGLLNERDVEELRRNRIAQRREIAASRDTIDPEYLELWDYASGRLGDRIAALQPALRPQAAPDGGIVGNGGMAQAQEIGRALSAAIREGQLTSDEAYNRFLDVERMNESALQLVTEVGAPMYWRSLSELEQRMNNIRREINNAAYVKRTQVFNLETYAKNPELPNIQKKELQMLYEYMPGYREVLEEWAEVFFNHNNDNNKVIRVDADGNEVGPITVLQCANEAEVEKFRNLVDSRIEAVVRGKVVPEVLRRLAEELAGENFSDDQKNQIIEDETGRAVARRTREAGQAGFNTLYALGCFESWSYRWDGDRWGVSPELHESRLVSDGVKEQMHPLNTLISKAHGGEKYGVFGEWAVNMLEGISKNDYSAIQVVHANTFEQAQQYWTLQGRTLLVPECYPKKLIGSAFDEIEVRGRTIADYLRTRTEIPWAEPETSELASKYTRTLNHANTYWKYNSSMLPLRAGVQEERWNSPLDKAKVKLPSLDTHERMMWIVYAQREICLDCNVPLLEGDTSVRTMAQDIYGEQDYFPVVRRGESVYFPWDGTKRKPNVESYLSRQRQQKGARNSFVRKIVRGFGF